MAPRLTSRAVGVALLIACGSIGHAGAFQSDPQGFPWSARRLNWSDYRGAPDNSADAAAMTVYQIDYSEECNGDAFTFSVQSMFRPEQSWVRPAVLTAPARAAQLLDHEQLHFDLSEVHARELRQWLAGLSQPCRLTADEREKRLKARVGDNAAKQLKYDRETDFGRNSSAQARWSAEVTRMLEKTAQWAAPGRASGPN